MNPPQLPPYISDKIEKYTVTSYLGSGAFGHGLKVTNPDGNELFLKLLKPDALANAKERMENEIWAMKQLSENRAFVTFIEEGTFNNLPFYVSTLARGETLRKLHSQHINEHGIPLGPKFVCAATEQILGALIYLEERKIYHRDLKDDNITTTQSANDITIVDFGSCKSDSLPKTNLTWLNPGATRFSPPSRDNAPSFIHSTHDLYSIGVLLYYLLTDRFPFEVNQSSGPSELTKRKLEYRHKRAWEVDSHIPQSLSEFIDLLLVPDDSKRPSSKEALNRIRIERKKLENINPSIRNTGRLAFTEVVRDPLHGDIRLTDTEFQIIHTPEFIRLRKLRQLGFSYIPFPGAEHSRYLHSLGTLFVTEQILRSIEDVTGRTISISDRLLARAYALLHDITHIPFGHTLEDELGLFDRHDSNRKRLSRTLLDEKTALGSLLFSSEIDRVRDFFQPDTTVSRLLGFKELLESAVGADVLDYIDRDAFFCGLDHKIDTALFRRFRLKDSVRDDEVEGNFYTAMHGEHGPRLDAAFASETVFLNRFALYLKVYTHPKKICAGAMLGKSIWEHTKQGKDLDNFEGKCETVGDSQLLSHLIENGRTLSTKKMAEMIQTESLFTSVFRGSLLQQDELNHQSYELKREKFEKEKRWLTPSGRYEAEKRLSTAAKIKENQVIIYASPKAPGYNKIRQWIENEGGQIEERAESHPIHRRIQERHLALWRIHVFCDPELDQESKSRLAQVSADFFGLTNELLQKNRQTFFLTGF